MPDPSHATPTGTTCLTAILLINSEDARRLVETRIGGDPALRFGLERCTRTQRGRRHVLFMPPALEQPWRALAARCAQEAGVEVIPVATNLAAALLERMRAAGDTWAAIVPATNILLDGQTIDACLALLAQRPADYSYGADFPQGTAPLVVSQAIVAMDAARLAPGDPHRSASQTLVECLPHFQGLPLPAPPSVRAPDLDLALDSAQQAADLDRIASALIDQGAPLTLARFVQQARQRRTARIHATFRLAQKRPYRAAGPRRRPATVLCLSFRASKISGGDNSFHNLITTIDRSRFRPLLASPAAAGAIVDTARRLEIPTLAVPLLQRTAGAFSTLLPAVLRLAGFAARHHADLVYANSSGVGWLGGAAALVLGLPLVTRVIEELDSDSLESGLIALADRVAVPSRFIAACCAELGIPEERIRVVHEGVDESWFAPAPAAVDLRASYGCPADAPLIGVASRLDDPKKALDQAIRAAALIVAERPDAHMMICGQSGLGAAQQVAQLDELIAQHGLRAHVHLAGAFADMRAIYPQFDLLLHPAPREPFGLVLTEAMAMGVPVVAVNGGGAPEQVRDGHTGLLVARADPRLLAAAARQLLGQPELRRQLGQQAREHVRRHFAAERFARGMEAVFAEAIQLRHDRVTRES
jgi:glycosyltransferase involved in cell wall biosynthesis